MKPEAKAATSGRQRFWLRVFKVRSEDSHQVLVATTAGKLNYFRSVLAETTSVYADMPPALKARTR